MKVAVLGASDKPDRYSNIAVQLLLQHGHEVYPVHPILKNITTDSALRPSLAVYANLEKLRDKPETLSIYLNAVASNKMADEILALRPDRVIFNPGTENPELKHRLEDAGIHAIDACTLVLLKTGQFEDA